MVPPRNNVVDFDGEVARLLKARVEYAMDNLSEVTSWEDCKQSARERARYLEIEKGEAFVTW